ncbi:transcriptional coactivator/pterin dehydratase [Hypoxylon rubiginosum]|uniref:Transcriptional coactivator/pterin dehydratase n=1 Tax=Hypoxylon rubiginosum TaxID=110542 RepID=A0ACB9Z3E6_9PEZI|nr:transcriptional coactivator/pterin dehydratase [Hypoxylon rubiginosum]
MHLRPLLCWASIPARAPTAIATRRAGGLTRCCAGAALSPHQRLLLFSQRGRRAFTCSSAMAATSTTPTKSQTPQFSPGVDEPALTRALEPLLASAELGGRWALVPGGEGLERSFKFKTFAKTWDFMTAVSLQCKLKNHHPEWSNVYNTTYIRWTTHNPKGLSAKDVELAAICDNLAKGFGEIAEEAGSGDSGALKQVADRAVANAGDCCTPKK